MRILSGGPCAPAPGGWWAESQLSALAPQDMDEATDQAEGRASYPARGPPARVQEPSLTFQTQGPRILWGNLLHPQRWLACSRAPGL